MLKTHFKGWEIPGAPPASNEAQTEVPVEESLDALCGHSRIFQLKKGHRYSTDDVVLGAFAAEVAPTVSQALELGSGIGTIGMIVAWKLSGVRFATIEAQEESFRLAQKSVKWNGWSDRFEQHLGDFRSVPLLREDGTPRLFDLVIGSPPYFPLGTGVLGDHPQKIACRFEVRGSIDDYCEKAAQHLGPGAVFACVFPVQPDAQRQRVEEAAAKAGLFIVRSRDVIFREGEAPLIGLFAMMKKDSLKDGLEKTYFSQPALIIRTREGVVSPEYLAMKLSIGFPPTS